MEYEIRKDWMRDHGLECEIKCDIHLDKCGTAWCAKHTLPACKK